jgi:hypothetical protein
MQNAVTVRRIGGCSLKAVDVVCATLAAAMRRLQRDITRGGVRFYDEKKCHGWWAWAEEARWEKAQRRLVWTTVMNAGHRVHHGNGLVVRKGAAFPHVAHDHDTVAMDTCDLAEV